MRTTDSSAEGSDASASSEVIARPVVVVPLPWEQAAAEADALRPVDLCFAGMLPLLEEAAGHCTAVRHAMRVTGDTTVLEWAFAVEEGPARLLPPRAQAWRRELRDASAAAGNPKSIPFRDSILQMHEGGIGLSLINARDDC